MLTVNNLSKTYTSANGNELTVLDTVSFHVESGERFAIVGPSGSGKSTLLGLCAGLDRSSTGNVLINGVDLNPLNEDERAALRNKYVGFVFQNFQLIPTLTALENVMTPLELRGEKEAAAKAMVWLDKVGLGSRADHYPTQLSGGEQQRIAIARAFANEPRILFADEPTGNLDGENGEKIADLLFEINREAGTTLVMVTHDMDLARRTGRILQLKNGKVVES